MNDPVRFERGLASLNKGIISFGSALVSLKAPEIHKALKFLVRCSEGLLADLETFRKPDRGMYLVSSSILCFHLCKVEFCVLHYMET